MKHRKRLWNFVMVLMLMTITGSSYGAIPLSEREALIAFYNSTLGEGWIKNTNWNGAVGTEDTWYGITVVADHVTSIDLGYNNLTGDVPSEIGNLTNLQYIYLGGNHLTGNIPPEIGNLTNLDYIHLGGNQITGNIPSEIGFLISLSCIQFWGNQLTGSIPPELGNLTNLMVLNLQQNQLTGKIPTEIGNLTNLKELYLDYNQLSGSIPNTLPNLTNLYDCEGTPWGSNGLYINNNQLFTNDPVVKSFIDLKACPGWESTQSLAKQAMPWVPLLLLCD